MKFSLIVLGAPGTHQCTQTALAFAKAAVAAQHSIYRIFFYHDGVHNGSTLTTPPQGEVNYPSEWHELAKENNIDLVACIASALRRGVINREEADRFEKPTANLDEPAFDLSGLGLLVDATENSDRIITFGN
ncbi:sulfurtransferase complex subunit TusD [Porticoccaceae bacterium LTM1]|nr:sulfurtransferase complex subunit TusD [Porticoccaceae bacterium LTM1]